MTSGEIAIIAGLLAQGGALVWGASTISSSVKSLSRSVDKLDGTVTHLDSRVNEHETRVTVLETLTKFGVHIGAGDA